MLQLHEIERTVKKSKKIGRGGSRGGTAGRGHKGQKARTGHHKVPAFLEGGQMPLSRRLPKRGFSNSLFKKKYTIISLQQLESWFDTNAAVNSAAIQEKLNVKKIENIKILNTGKLTKKLHCTVFACSAGAKESIEKNGGSVTLIKE